MAKKLTLVKKVQKKKVSTGANGNGKGGVSLFAVKGGRQADFHVAAAESPEEAAKLIAFEASGRKGIIAELTEKIAAAKSPRDAALIALDRTLHTTYNVQNYLKRGLKKVGAGPVGFVKRNVTPEELESLKK
jgi:hypothetical protein